MKRAYVRHIGPASDQAHVLLGRDLDVVLGAGGVRRTPVVQGRGVRAAWYPRNRNVSSGGVTDRWLHGQDDRLRGPVRWNELVAVRMRFITGHALQHAIEFPSFGSSG